jgi:hypothetical protein
MADFLGPYSWSKGKANVGTRPAARGLLGGGEDRSKCASLILTRSKGRRAF